MQMLADDGGTERRRTNADGSPSTIVAVNRRLPSFSFLPALSATFVVGASRLRRSLSWKLAALRETAD